MPSLTTTSSLLNMLGVAPATDVQGLLNLVCGLLLMGSLAGLMWKAAVHHLAAGRCGDALRTDEAPAQEVSFGCCR